MPERVLWWLNPEEDGTAVVVGFDPGASYPLAVKLVPEARLREVEAERDRWHSLVKSLCDEWNDECPPGCDSYAHEDDCGATSITVAMRKRGEEIAALRAERDALVELVRDVARSGVALEDVRLDYVEIQLDKDTWAAARAILDREAK